MEARLSHKRPLSYGRHGIRGFRLENRDEILATLATVADFIRYGASRFNAARLHFGHGTDNAADEARVLVLHALHLDHNTPDSLLSSVLTASEKHDVLALLNRRIVERKPSAYLTQQAWFAGLEFHVDERVLVPRSPIAELIERGFSPWLDGGAVTRVLDLCTGSGCIAIACAYAFPDARVDATDCSPAALEVAAENRRRHGLEDRVELIAGDLFEGVGGRRYDVIVSNPPYATDEEVAALPPEHRHEPRLGLAAGQDGLDVVRRIVASARSFLAPDGVLVVEVGGGAAVVEATWPELPFTWLEFERGGDGVFMLRAEDLVRAGRARPRSA
jgi:ribosomal protein L3 glutamine methyltransferase